MNQKTFREFEVGDVVRVVDEPYDDCPFGWVHDMDDLCGSVVTIRHKEYSMANGTIAYWIEGNGFMWCGNCFLPLEPEEDIPDIDDTLFMSIVQTGR